MSVIPEVILQRTIINGFRQVRKDPRLLDSIFKNLHQDQLAALKNFILNNSVDFSINYPKKDMRVPALVLLLKNESESETFLGDVLGDEANPFVPDPEMTVDTLGGHAASATGSSGLPMKLAGPLAVDRQATNPDTGEDRLYFTDDATDLVESLLENPVGNIKVHVVSGAGAGRVYDVVRISTESLDIVGTFDPQLDSTSIVDLRVPRDPELATGEPSRVYSHSEHLLRKGVNFDVSYQIHVLAAQQEEVIYLYSTLKALLLSQRVFLESQGVQALKISGSDFAPRTEFLPTEVFQRMMTIQFVYPFTFFEEQEVFTQFRVDILPEPGDRVLIGTTVTLDTD